jgi:Protein of unknown function (DUF2971)
MSNQPNTDDAAKTAAILRNPMPTVPLLYHYTGRVDAESLLKTIAAELFYFSNPLDFNDALDMKMPIKVKKAGETNPYFGVISGNNELQNAFDSQRHPGLPELLCNLSDIRQPINVEKIRVFCTTECDTNNLMWSHYGGRHRGVSFGLDWNYLALSIIPFKVHYQDEYSLTDDGVTTFNGEAPLRFRVKTCDWQTECEWRFFTQVRTVNEASFVQLRDVLKTITLGYSASRETRKMVISLVNRYKPNVEIHQIDIVNGKFESNILSMPPNFDSISFDNVQKALDNARDECLISGDSDTYLKTCTSYFFHLEEQGEKKLASWYPIIAAARLTRNQTLRNRVEQWCPIDLINSTKHTRAEEWNKPSDEIDIWCAYFSYLKPDGQHNLTDIEGLNLIDDIQPMSADNRELFYKIGFEVAKEIASHPASTRYKDLVALRESNLKMAKKINGEMMILKPVQPC